VAMLSALASHRDDGQLLGGALRTALTSADALAAGDLVRWRMLASQRSVSGPFLDPSWTLSWTEAFAPSEPVLVCSWDRRRLVGLAAIQRVIESWGGRHVAVLQSRTNAESFRFAFLSWKGRVEIQEQLWRALCDSRRGDVIRIEHVPDGSTTLAAALTVARELGWRCLVRPTFLTPWCPLSRAMPWDHGLTRRFKRNLRRREEQLAELGDVRLDVVTAGAGLKQALNVFYRLEASGWKGRSGTAVAQRPQVKRFYDGLVDRAPAQVWIPILTVCGDPVAAYVLRVFGRNIFALKTGYDETYSKYAPGLVLTARVIRHALERGMKMLDFMANQVRWKGEWAGEVRPHYELLLFAPSPAGRYAYWARYGLREHAKKFPGVVRLARWLRAKRS
jgi:CelD/BcsL family acetyltransferase involved in cellulose biosynthesis